MESFADVFDQTTLRTMVGPEMDIQLKEGAQPFYVSGSRPIPIPFRAEVGKIVVCGTVRFANHAVRRSIALKESFRTVCLLTGGHFLMQRNPGY